MHKKSKQLVKFAETGYNVHGGIFMDRLSVYRRDHVVAPSLCDASSRLGLVPQFALVQDIAAEHAEHLGVGASVMMERGAIWLVVHTRLDFFARAPMMAPIAVSTWPVRCAPEDLRLYRRYRIMSGETVLCEGKTEWMILNADNGRLVRARDAGFPTDLEFCEEVVCPEPFLRLPDDWTDGDVCFRRRVAASDIDLAAHMNNVAYVRAMLDSFASDELAALPAKRMEIRYGDPCHEGDEIAILRRRTETGYRFAIRKANGKLAASAALTLHE